MNDKTTKIMFTIDLLRGEGVPAKSSPAGIAFAVMTAAVPVIVAVIFIGLYMNNKVVMSLKEREIKVLSEKIEKLSDAMELQKTLEKEKMHYNVCLGEVKSTIEKFDQWSPILTTLIDNMPSSVVLTELNVGQDTVKKNVPKKDNPNAMMEIDALVTTMQIIVSDSSQSDSDKAVKEFRDYLCSSSVLGPKLEKSNVSQETGTQGGMDVVNYMIDCVFKDGL
ncbi:MAG: hypothetical protein JW715_17030 [Sedimentisphaerales bacterium]|nr:hypothetical protein [Sedimentisphaerales bacterium]